MATHIKSGSSDAEAKYSDPKTLDDACLEKASVETQLDSPDPVSTCPDGGWRAWSVVVGVSVIPSLGLLL